MDTNLPINLKILVALAAMVVIGAALLAIFGEAAKHVIPAGLLYFSVINKVYLLAAASLLLLIGLGMMEIGHMRNLTVLFIALVILIVVAYEVDTIASTAVQGGLYISKVPARYAQLFLQGLDGLSLVLGAIGVFLLLLKILDKVKDLLTNASKS